MSSNDNVTLQALQSFTEWQLRDILALRTSHPVLTADKAERLGALANQAKETANTIGQYSENIRLIQQWMKTFYRLYGSTSRRLQDLFICLQRAANHRDPMRIPQTLELCEVRIRYNKIGQSM